MFSNVLTYSEMFSNVLKCLLATMGWLRSVGSLRLQVCFAEYSLFYRALLQKETCIFEDAY